MFDGHFKGVSKPHGVKHVQPVADPTVASVVALPPRGAEPVAGARAEAPGVIEIIFAAGALETGNSLSVNVEEIVPFTPPAILAEGNGHDSPDVLAPALQVGDQIVAAGLGRGFLAILRMGIGRVGG